MFGGGFGRKHKSHGKNYGKKDKETHGEIEYPLIASEEGGGLGHTKAQVAKQELVGQKAGQTAAPAPAITLGQADDLLAGPPTKKDKVAAGLNLASQVVSGDRGKLSAVKGCIDIARGEGEGLSSKTLQEQIKHAEKASKGSSLSQIGSTLGITKGNKISRASVGVGAAPMIGPVAPPEFFDEPDKNKKQKVASFFAKPFKKK
mgnify:CR=1 FL=1